tara:strand:- start:2752 stop:4974 length:2223 start_codon:yes stop_codon:yes gene_type:complete
MSNSAFNMSKCGSSGGRGGACNPSGWAKIQATDGNEITIVSDDKLRSALREIHKDYYGDNKEVGGLSSVKDHVELVYDCPKAGDAIYYNPTKNGWDLASAELDNSNYFDTERLIESLAVVEKVLVECKEGDTNNRTEARVVFFGKVTFPEESSKLQPGIVYYLADTLALLNESQETNRQSVTSGLVDTGTWKRVGSNVVHSNYEPTISKPVFVATGDHTAIVTNYRPLTGSPTGGRELSEEYKVRIDPHIYTESDSGNILYTGWKIRVENTGTVTSRNNLVLEITYNKLEGPQESREYGEGSESKPTLMGSETYVYHIDIGVLHNEAEANVKDDDTIVSYKVIDFIPTSFIENTGIGEVNVKLKVMTQSTANISFNDRYNSPEVLLANADDIKTSRLVPTLEWTGSCADNLQNDNDIYVKGSTILPASDVKYEEGSVFEVKLVDSKTPSVGSDDVYEFKVPMPYNIGFKIDSLIENSDGDYENDDEWTAVTGTFKLSLPSKEVIEIIPVSSSGQTVVEKILRISAVTLDGNTLPSTHWANQYSTSQLKNNRVVCLSNSCCIDEFEQFIPDNSASIEKSITSILTNGDSQLINNKDGATFYSKSVNAQSWQGTKSRLALSWKNFRENTVFCYPAVDNGSEPAFMTIYADEARIIESIENHEKTDNESAFYDPRYTIMEVGAQNTLNGQLVRVTVNSGSKVADAPETCFVFKFSGSIKGTHFTLRELKHFDPSYSERQISKT